MDSSGQYTAQQQPIYLNAQQAGSSPLPSYPSRALSPANVQSNSHYPTTTYAHASLSNVSTQLPSPVSTANLTASSTSSWTAVPSGSPASQMRSPPLKHPEIRPKSELCVSRNSVPLLEQDQAKFVKPEGEDGMPATSDFVKKLYKMLEDKLYSNVVCWGPQGDCFVIKDINKFSTTILPRMFKHSNFASFVRQLNKYDFHKIKNTDDNEVDEHTWIFKHPDFHVDGRDALENIKRKVPGRKARQLSHSTSPLLTGPLETLKLQIERMTQQQEQLTAHIRDLEVDYENVLSGIITFQRGLAQQDSLMQNLISYFVRLETVRTNPERHQVHEAQGGFVQPANPFLQVSEAQRMMGGSSYPDMDIARTSLVQMNEISRRAEAAGMTFSTATPTSNERPSSSSSSGTLTPSGSQQPFKPSSSGTLPPGASRQDVLARIEELNRSSRTSSARMQSATPFNRGDSPAGRGMFNTDGSTSDAVASQTSSWGVPTTSTDFSHQGLQVYTVGHLMPRSTMDDANGNWSFDPNSLNTEESLSTAVVMPTPQGMGGDPQQDGERERQQPITMVPDAEATSSAGPSSQTLRVRRATYVPLWAVPPKVLLVDDDAISRKLSSRFLQIFGCTIDVAVDGVGAVNKMNLEKYDLVLMDIVMPKLDGMSATSLIRQFDHRTPIISMTSNAKPNEIVKYYSSGMNDILPKPFTKDGLLVMLEKHLMHLKAIRTMAKMPPSIGIPPLSDSSFSQAFTSQVAKTAGSSSSSSAVDGRVNPLAGMGLSDEQYSIILQNLVNGESFQDADTSVTYSEKRALDDRFDDRESKRSRFEEIE